MRRSVDGRLQTPAPRPPAAAARAASQRPEVTSHPVPTIVITSSTSCHDDAQRRNTDATDVSVDPGFGDVIDSRRRDDVIGRPDDVVYSETAV